jgi:hypothetical protein
MSPQELQVWGKFQEDSVKIGQTIHYSLWVQHRGKNELFFPNAQINVAPFEIIQKDYFKTKMIRPGVYVDSAVYQMRLFSLQNPKVLQIPVYTASDIDCTAIYPQADSLYVKKLVPNAASIDLDSLYQSIPFEPLTPKKDIKTFLFDFLVLLIIIGIINWIFGKRIRMGFELYLLWRKNRDFQRNFARLKRNVNESDAGLRNLEKALILWKTYLENITGLGFSTSTSKEIIDLLPDKQLEKSLNDLDFAIYGGNFSERTVQSLNNLLKIAETTYKKGQQKIHITYRKK